MADKYIDQAGSNTSPYTSESTAGTHLGTVVGTSGIWTLGERLFADSAYTESVSASTYISVTAGAGTYKEPLLINSVSSLSTPTTLQAGATVNTTGNYFLSFLGYARFNGFTFHTSSSGGSNATAYLGVGYYGATYNAHIVFSNCILKTSSTDSTLAFLRIGYMSTSLHLAIELVDTVIDVPGGSSAFLGTFYGNYFYARNISVATATTLAAFFNTSTSSSGKLIIEDSDLSSVTIAGTAFSLGGNTTAYIKNCKFKSGTTLVYMPTSVSSYYLHPSYTFIDCFVGSTFISYYNASIRGYITVDTGLYSTTSPTKIKDDISCSLRFDTSSFVGTEFPLASDWISCYGEASTSVTLNIECLVGADGSAELNDNELWLEVEYMSSSSDTSITFVTTQCAILGTPAGVAAGTTTWENDGYSTERTHKLTATFTPLQDGAYRYRVCLAKASTTVYLNIPTA